MTFPDNTVYSFDRVKGFKTASSLIESMADNSMPNYGIISNSGRLILIDKDEVLRTKLSTLSTDKGISLKLMLNDDCLGSFLVDPQIEYNVYTKEASISVRPFLEKLKDKKISFRLYTSRDYRYAYNAYTILTKLMEEASKIGFNFVFEEDLSKYLYSIEYGDVYIAEDSLWEQFSKVANSAQLLIFEDKNGNVRIQRLK